MLHAQAPPPPHHIKSFLHTFSDREGSRDPAPNSIRRLKFRPGASLFFFSYFFLTHPDVFPAPLLRKSPVPCPCTFQPSIKHSLSRSRPAFRGLFPLFLLLRCQVRKQRGRFSGRTAENDKETVAFERATSCLRARLVCAMIGKNTIV